MGMTTAEICERVGGQLHGPGDVEIDGLNGIDDAGPGELTFISSEKFVSAWAESGASATLVNAALVESLPASDRPVIAVDDADLAMGAVLEAFAPAWPRPEPRIHSTAVIDPTADVAETARIGANVVLGPRVRIGPETIVHAGAVVMEHATIGAGCVIFPGCVIRERCTLGDRVILHPNVSIGADGFGYRPAADGSGITKIPQIGTVRIGDDVEIGSGTCVDRGKFAATLVGAGTKIDNLCQIAHNCRIGAHCIIVGGTNIAGSVKIGDGAVVGGMSAIADHLTIGPGARLAAGSHVMADVPAGETVGGYPARELSLSKRTYATFFKLPEIFQRLRKLEKKLK